jgi:hypothetical protein
VEGDFFQEFDITTGVDLGQNNRLDITTPQGSTNLDLAADFIPLYYSPDAEVSGDVVFAGYGITAPQQGWDDYAELDVTGKIVFCLSGEPREDDPESPFDGARPTIYSGLRWKASNAGAHGASALLIGTDASDAEGGGVEALGGFKRATGIGESGIPVIRVNQKAADLLWSTMGAPLPVYQSEMDRHMSSFGAPLPGIGVSLAVELARENVTTWNVAARLPGCDPALREEWVIVGAHYDHLGWGIEGSLYEGPEPQIHNGADDNASGVAGVLELARLFIESPHPPARSILFVCFSAEELGLLGSKAYVENPLVPLDDTLAMINMDMIGRVRPDNAGAPICTLQGIGSAIEWPEIVPERTPDGEVVLISQADPIGGGDYIPFYLAGIPVLNFFSGIHDDYSRPTDDAELINYQGEASVLGAVHEIVQEVANRPGRLIFQECNVPAALMSGELEPGGDREVYLGTVPDFTRTEGGFWIAEVREDSPADLAGLEGGDRIIRVGAYEIGNIYDYTYALEQYRPGDTVEIVVLREGIELTLTATLGSRDEKRH